MVSVNAGDESMVAGMTFGEFAEQWKSLKLLKLGTELKLHQRTRVQIGRYLRKDLLPHLGHRNGRGRFMDLIYGLKK